MTRIASHRGGTLEFGDSTPVGFKATAQMALEEVEFDVHPTADGAIMVHHDPTLDRTTDRTGAIRDLSEAEVRAATINYGAGGHPLSLEELCAIYRGSAVDFRCEIKPGPDGRPYADFVHRVIATLEREGMLARTVFSSFLIETQDELARATERPRLWLVSPPVLNQLGVAATLELARSHAIPEIGVHVDCADRDLMDAVQAAGCQFGCWAAHTQQQIEKTLRLGVKVFTTDRPSLAIAVRDRFVKGEQP
ncbi:glycerophosphodiester phosphodiesterase [Stappia taiwanensis]|uniref:Glycerophosphodiester phosphodiesterase n=1 Tax=Stappia taiwanensis TaxID=992267 RepID=A0A838Y430_9HYPH|nr:glycerophosphodiester phosphodiesterase family protein [Stappia taiwanensis]MBA4613620.1 glycerophosphodiester phosphodiesterase [Stappia taiwanensis]GGE98718.1 glycerophosphoryl diester phosphodiesterase [Stappia taiwanensis]